MHIKNFNTKEILHNLSFVSQGIHPKTRPLANLKTINSHIIVMIQKFAPVNYLC